MTLMMVATALGWVGAVAGLVAYAMVSRGRWNADSLAFQGTNMVAGVTLLTVAATNGVWPSVAANIAAILIGANAVATVLRGKKRSARNAPGLTVVEGTAQDRTEPARQPVAPPHGVLASPRSSAGTPRVGHRAYAEAA
jgi:hypothetical protein